MDDIESIEYSRVLYEDMQKFFQWRVGVSEFRGVHYLNLRKWFLSFEGEWIPSKEGATMPLSIAITAKMVLALGEILSEAEKTDLHDTLKTIFEEANSIDPELPK